MSDIATKIKTQLIELIRNTVDNHPDKKIGFGNTLITVEEPNSGMLDYPNNQVQLTAVEMEGTKIVATGQYDPDSDTDEDPDPLALTELDCDALIEILHTIHGGDTSGDEINAEFAAFVPYSTLIDEEIRDWIEDKVNSSMPFSYGDCNRSLVTAADLATHIETQIESPESDEEEEEEMLENQEGVNPETCRAFLNRVRALGDIYVDLAN